MDDLCDTDKWFRVKLGRVEALFKQREHAEAFMEQFRPLVCMDTVRAVIMTKSEENWWNALHPNLIEEKE